MSIRLVLAAALCGGCGSVAGNPCPGGMECGGTCVDPDHDQLNCGACGTACSDGKTCEMGSCALVNACPGGLADCSGTCAALDTDPDNCGACGKTCAPASACRASECDPRVWQMLAPVARAPAFSDFTPTGETRLFSVESTFNDVFAFPDPTHPLGTVSAVAPPPVAIVDLVGPAWVGGDLLLVQATSIYKYSVGGNAWTTPVAATLAHAVGQSQSTGDDSGFVYALAADKTLLQFKVSDGTVVNIAGPSALTTAHPRLAWDSASKRVYLGDLGDTTGAFRSFDPQAGTFADKKPFPQMVGFGAAFCSDRKGHVFAVDNETTYAAAVWMYTAATDSWTEIAAPPFSHGAVSSCTVSADGWLYLAGTSNLHARVEL